MNIRGNDLKGLSTPNNTHREIESINVDLNGKVVYVLNPNTIQECTSQWEFSVAGNSSASFYAPKGMYIKPRTGYLTLVNDATVANRYVYWTIYNRANLAIGIPWIGAAVTASATSNMNVTGEMTANGNYPNIIVNQPINGDKGEYYKVTVTGGVAGDTISGRVLFQCYTLGE